MISKMFSFLILLSVASTVFAVDAPTGKNITTCFATLDSAYSQIKENVEIENMPRIRNMDVLFPFCAGFSSATIAQHYYCKSKHIKCTDLPLKKEMSPIAMAGLLNIGEIQASNGDYRFLTRYDWKEYKVHPVRWRDGILESRQFWDEGILGGGPSANALHNFNESPEITAESCYPFDRLVKLYQEKYPNENDRAAAFANVIAELETQFSRSNHGEKICVECLQKTINEKLLSPIKLEHLHAYLKVDSFGRFLYGITVDGDHDCMDSVRPRPSPDRMGYFPKEGLSATPAEVVTKIKEVLKNGHPIDTGVCPYRENGKCLGRHSVVISGYRKMCSPASGACRDVFKVHNSWGIDWQQRHNDGWVDAITLFGDEMQGTAALSWLE